MEAASRGIAAILLQCVNQDMAAPRNYPPQNRKGEERRYFFATFPAAGFFTALPFPSSSSALRT